MRWGELMLLCLFQTEQTTCPDVQAGKSRTAWALPAGWPDSRATCDWKASPFCLLTFIIAGWWPSDDAKLPVKVYFAERNTGVGGKWWLNLKCHSSAVEVWVSLGSLLRSTVLGSLQASQEAAASSPMAPRNKHGLWLSSSSLPHLCSSQCWVIPLCEFPFLLSKPLCFCLCLRMWESFFTDSSWHPR